MACFVRDVISLFKLYSNLDIGSVVFTMVRISLDMNLRDNSWLKVFLELLIRKILKIKTEDRNERGNNFLLKIIQKQIENYERGVWIHFFPWILILFIRIQGSCLSRILFFLLKMAGEPARIMLQGVLEKLCFFTIHCNPSLAYIAVRDLQSSQHNASVQSLLLAGNFFKSS